MRNQFIITLLMSALSSFPGGERVKKALEGLLHPDADPTNNVNEIASHVGELAIGALLVYEGVSNNDVVDNAEFEALVKEVKSVIARVQVVIVKKA